MTQSRSQVSPTSFPVLPNLIPSPPLPHSHSSPTSFPLLPNLITTPPQPHSHSSPTSFPVLPNLIPSPPLPHSQSSPNAHKWKSSFLNVAADANGRANTGEQMRLNNMCSILANLHCFQACTERGSEPGYRAGFSLTILSSLHAHRQDSRGG